MTPRGINSLLWTGAVLCVAGSALAVVLAATMPLEEAPRAAAGTGHAAPSTQAAASSSETFVLDDVWSRPLRTGLTDTGPAINRAASSQAPSGMAPLTLVGTIGHSVALLQSGPTVEAALVGDVVAGAEVVAIRPGQVELRRDEQVFTLTKASEEPGP